MVVLGFFLPPVAIILMVTPILLPSLKALQIDLVWYGIVMTILMEMGLILRLSDSTCSSSRDRAGLEAAQHRLGNDALSSPSWCSASCSCASSRHCALAAESHLQRRPEMKDGAPHVRDNRRVQRLARVVAALGSRIDGKRVATQDDGGAPRSGDRARRSRLPRRQQPESRRTSSPRRSPRATRRRCTTSISCSRCSRSPSHMDLFERGIARRVDFSFSGPQATRLARLVQSRKIEIGAIHTYLELFGRYFIDLTPNVCLIAAQSCDAAGNLYTGPEYRGHARRSWKRPPSATGSSSRK
jgi:hypothetical protein